MILSILLYNDLLLILSKLCFTISLFNTVPLINSTLLRILNVYVFPLFVIIHLYASAGIIFAFVSNWIRLSYKRAQSLPDLTSVA